MRASTPQHPKHTGEEHSACSVYWCQGKRGRPRDRMARCTSACEGSTCIHNKQDTCTHNEQRKHIKPVTVTVELVDSPEFILRSGAPLCFMWSLEVDPLLSSFLSSDPLAPPVARTHTNRRPVTTASTHAQKHETPHVMSPYRPCAPSRRTRPIPPDSLPVTPPPTQHICSTRICTHACTLTRRHDDGRQITIVRHRESR